MVAKAFAQPKMLGVLVYGGSAAYQAANTLAAAWCRFGCNVPAKGVVHYDMHRGDITRAGDIGNQLMGVGRAPFWQACATRQRRGFDMAKGEGAHGGHVIGHTRSGKPVYSSNAPHYKAISKLKGNAQQRAMNEHFAGWDSEDHRDALDFHDAQIPGGTTSEKRKGKSSMPFKAAALHYTKRQIMRMGETGEEPENDNKSLENNMTKSTKGEGAHGGHVIGHTRSGKPIYQFRRTQDT